MSHGSVIFSGPAELATKYFIQNPSYDIVRTSAFDVTLLIEPSTSAPSNASTQHQSATSTASTKGAFSFGGAPNSAPFGLKPGPNSMSDPMDYLLKVSAAKINRKERYPLGAGSSKASSAGSHHSEEAEHHRANDDGAEVIYVGPRATDLQEVSWGETVAIIWRQGKLLFTRSYYSLFRRWRLIASAIFLHLCFALIFPVTLGDTSNDEYGKNLNNFNMMPI
jgi:hypothetical protein